MKWKIDFDELEDAKFDIKRAIETVEDFISAFEKLIASLVETNEGQVFTAISEKAEEKVDMLENVKESAEELKKSLEDYVESVEEENQWSGSGLYVVNISKAEKMIDKLKKIMEEPFEKQERKINNFTDDYESNIRKYNNVDWNIDLHEEYKDEPDMIEYIKSRRNKIEDKILDFRKNAEIVEDAIEDVKELERRLDELI